MRNQNLNTLYQLTSQEILLPLLQRLGTAQLYTGSEDLTQYQLLVIEGAMIKDMASIILKIEDAQCSVLIVRATSEQIQLLSKTSGISPANPSTGVIFGRKKDKSGRKHWILKYLTSDPTEENMRGHVKIIQDPPINNALIPTAWPQTSFGYMSLLQQRQTYKLSGIYHNLQTLTLLASTQFYMYHDDTPTTIPNPNPKFKGSYYVIAVTKMDEVEPGNLLSFMNQNDNGDLDIYQWFAYELAMSAQDENGVIMTTNVSIKDPSPGNSGQSSSLVDSVDLFTMQLYSFTGASWQDEAFQASYSNTINTPCVSNFTVRSVNGQINGVTGIDFEIPGRNEGKDTDYIQIANFEVITIFNFDAALVTDGKLNVKFNLGFDLQIWQENVQWITNIDGFRVIEDDSTFEESGTTTILTDLFDLVTLTAPAVPPAS